MSTAKTATANQLQFANRKERSPWGDAWRALLKNRLAVASGIFIIILIFVAVFAKYIAPYPYDKGNLVDNYALPGPKYLLGADFLGRDILSRTIYGAQVSLAVGFVGAFVSLLIGMTYGLISGYSSTRVDNLMMRFVDFLYAMPILI
ncbi:MAG: ABC transporter permease, partial [Anaerolineae bacterium]